jgi:sorting nexin-5/6/32
LAIFQETEFSVTRQHEEFIWLHDRYNENEEYAGLIVSSFVSERKKTNNIQ